MSIHGERLSLRGKNAQTGAVRDSLSTPRGPIFRTDYCPRKISQGKRHSQTLSALVARRTDVLFAMIHSRTGTLYSAINRPDNLTGASSLSLTVAHERSSPAAGVRGSHTPRSNLMIVMNALSYFQSISITTRLIFSCTYHENT